MLALIDDAFKSFFDCFTCLWIVMQELRGNLWISTVWSAGGFWFLRVWERQFSNVFVPPKTPLLRHILAWKIMDGQLTDSCIFLTGFLLAKHARAFSLVLDHTQRENNKNHHRRNCRTWRTVSPSVPFLGVTCKDVPVPQYSGFVRQFEKNRELP